jgi:sulfur carrier protein
MLVNGEKIELSDNPALTVFLSDRGYNLDRIAVERNGRIVPKADFSAEMLDDSDKLEVVCFVGGG